VVEQAPFSLVCGIGPLALWSMKWLHFPSPRNGAWAMEQLVRACLSFVFRTQPVLVFGTPRDNHNMGKGRHSQRGTFHCLSLAQSVLANMLCWIFSSLYYFNFIYYCMRNCTHQERYTKSCINVFSWIAWLPSSKHCSLGIIYHAEVDFELLL
jgi:hypothetical protein